MFDLEAVYWTLSTIAQTMVALVAFVGFIAVWRLQVLEQASDELGLKRDSHPGTSEAAVENARRLTLMIEITKGRIAKIHAALIWLARFGIIATALSLGLLAIAPRLVGTKRVAADLGGVAPVAFIVLLVVVTLALRFAWDVLSLSFRS